MTLSEYSPNFSAAVLSPPDPNQSGIVFDVRRFSIQDGPGIRTTVFFKGCPLDCWWCHNPESQALQLERMQRTARCLNCGACVPVCPQQAIHMEGGSPVTEDARCTLCGQCTRVCYAEAREIIGCRMSAAGIMQQVRQDIIFFDESSGGVTFSGGEPLMQPEFLYTLLQLCRAEDIHTAVDTSGYAAWQSFEQINPLVNLYLFDLKSMDDQRHRVYTGVSNHLILQNLQKISEQGIKIILRLPIVPGINDSDAEIQSAVDLAAGLASLDHVDLLPYHSSARTKYEGLGRVYRLPDVPSPAEEALQALAERFRRRGLMVHIGG